ncbi:MAG: ABC transporter permease [Clostridiales bacterium]|nr:ABC transporter permease [Clostridiales bacterium]
MATDADFAVQANAGEASVAVAVPADETKAEKKPETKSEFISDNVRIVSPMKLVLKRFFRSRLSVIGLVMFLAVVIFSFIGPAFVSWEEDEVDYSQAQLILYEFQYYEDGDYYTVSINRPDDLNSHAPAFTYGINKNGEKALHLLGTDKTGYDIWVRLMYGGRLSLMLSFLVVLVYTLIGIIMGGLAGYFGGWVDMVIMRIIDILNCLPSLPIMLILGAFFDGSGLDEGMRVYFMMGVLTLMSWSGTARLVRGQILFLREQEYMIATDALGFSPARKIFKHLVPNVMPQLIVSMTLGLGGTILTEASLSFLNLGAPPTVASLGRMVNAAKEPLILSNYVLDWLPAGIIIIIAVVAFNFIGDGLRDALDPKMKR